MSKNITELRDNVLKEVAGGGCNDTINGLGFNNVLHSRTDINLAARITDVNIGTWSIIYREAVMDEGLYRCKGNSITKGYEEFVSLFNPDDPVFPQQWTD